MTAPSLVLTTTDALAAVIERLDRIEAALIARPPEWVSIEDYAAKAGLSERTVHRRIQQGKLEASGCGQKRRVRVSQGA